MEYERRSNAGRLKGLQDERQQVLANKDASPFLRCFVVVVVVIFTSVVIVVVFVVIVVVPVVIYVIVLNILSCHFVDVIVVSFMPEFRSCIAFNVE